MTCLVVASNLTHAQALVAWLNLAPERTEIATYGSLVPRFYRSAYLARPLEGVTEDHAAWVLMELKPKIIGQIHTVAPEWRFHLPDDDLEFEPLDL